MTPYTSHKQVKATPMNRFDYVNYRGWELPADEDGTDEGYLVEYLDGGGANHPGHLHYISWSPKDVFENGYALTGEPQNKVEHSHIKSLVDSLTYKYAKIGEKVTVCCAFLPCGFQVSTGESACVDPANYNKELGEKYAKERAETTALNKLWELEGYLLRVTGKTSDKF